VTIKVNYW